MFGDGFSEVIRIVIYIPLFCVCVCLLLCQLWLRTYLVATVQVVYTININIHYANYLLNIKLDLILVSLGNRRLNVAFLHSFTLDELLNSPLLDFGCCGGIVDVCVELGLD